jgi:hypothetical protein
MKLSERRAKSYTILYHFKGIDTVRIERQLWESRLINGSVMASTVQKNILKQKIQFYCSEIGST